MTSSAPSISLGHWEPATPDRGQQEQQADEPEFPDSIRLLPVPAGQRMSCLSQVIAAVRHASRSAARGLRERDGGLIRSLAEAKPESIAEHAAYVRSRAWVPPGHEGGIAERAGVLWGVTIGRASVAAGNAISGTGARPLRGCIAFGTAYALLVLLTWAAGHVMAAFELTAGLLGFLACAALILALIPVSRLAPRAEYEDGDYDDQDGGDAG